MALISPRIVQVPKPPALAYGQVMRQHRAWLDANKIQPAAFKSAYCNGGIGFEFRFNSEREATLFDKEFG